MADTASRLKATNVTRRARHVAHLITGVAVLIVSALLVDEYYVTSLEHDVFQTINGAPDFLYWPAWVLMQFGNLLAVPAVFVIAIVLRRWRLAAMFGIAGVAKWYLARVVKDLVQRERPAAIFNDVIARDVPTAGLAFVSGHATVAFSLATLAHPYVKDRRLRIAIWTVAVLVCLGRMYVGAHLPLDVIGGAGLGVAIGALVHLILGVPSEELPGKHELEEENEIREAVEEPA
ncbi:MAG: phosphatase PAP2 family protein [Actinomycetota bacterium]